MTKRVSIKPLEHSKQQHTAIFVHRSELISKTSPAHCTNKCNRKKKIKLCHLHFGVAISILVWCEDSTYPVLLRSISDGKNDRRYVHVQMSSKITDNKLWKLNRALCNETKTERKCSVNGRRKFNYTDSTLYQITIFFMRIVFYMELSIRYMKWRVNKYYGDADVPIRANCSCDKNCPLYNASRPNFNFAINLAKSQQTNWDEYKLQLKFNVKFNSTFRRNYRYMYMSNWTHQLDTNTYARIFQIWQMAWKCHWSFVRHLTCQAFTFVLTKHNQI